MTAESLAARLADAPERRALESLQECAKPRTKETVPIEDPDAKPRRTYRRLYQKEAPAPTLADKPYRMTLVIHPEIADVMREYARANRRPVNDVVRAALLAYFDQQGIVIDLPARSAK